MLRRAPFAFSVRCLSGGDRAGRGFPGVWVRSILNGVTYRTAIAAFLAAGVMLGASASARADQNDPRLDDLFQALQTVEDAALADRIEQRIWVRWTQIGDPLVGGLMQSAARAMDRGAYDRAIATLNQVVQAAPNYAEGWNRRATARFLAGDYEGSLADIERVLTLEPRHFGAISGRGQCLVALGREKEALAAFRRALEINPHLKGAEASIEALEERLSGAPI